ncbi:unnamed protein product [Onchocerca flexuosa]|uniref:Uncharacterized protein n=1 Tax=Onchocerca flexuosa TaxID=387005 RepID=A0A183H0A2_9BILA|nr:unnamed protein product [Onchocerca flexuosa]
MAKLLNKKKRPEWEREGFFFSSPHFPECAVTILYRLNVSSLSSPTSAHFHGKRGAATAVLIIDMKRRGRCTDRRSRDRVAVYGCFPDNRIELDGGGGEGVPLIQDFTHRMQEGFE